MNIAMSRHPFQRACLAALLVLAPLSSSGCEDTNKTTPAAGADTAAVSTTGGSVKTAASAAPSPTASSGQTAAGASDSASAAPMTTAAGSTDKGNNTTSTAEATASTASLTESATETASASASQTAATTTSSETSSAPTVLGKKTSDPLYAVWMQSAGSYKVGKTGSVQAVVIAKGGYKCNDAYPFKVKLSAPPAGVSFPSMIARNVSKGKKRTTVSVPFTPSSAGKKTISGKFYYSVCNESSCKFGKSQLSVTVDVKP